MALVNSPDNVRQLEELWNTPPYEDRKEVKDPVLQALEGTRAVVSQGWTRNVMHTCGHYCLLGGLEKAVFGKIITIESTSDSMFSDAKAFFQIQHILRGNAAYVGALKELKKVIGCKTIIGVIKFNDTTSKFAVLSAIDEAISNRRSRI